MELRAQGHSVGASLGQVPLQNNQELKTAQSLEKTLDSMELRRGEYH
jgi:hypothetical protein